MKNDLTGQKFGFLSVIESAGIGPCRKRIWHCKCDCGGHCISTTGNLRSGTSSSCGCKRITAGKARRKHGRNQQDRTYRIWAAMRGRCHTKSNSKYADYGGRGIAVCEAWNSFEQFLKDMGEAPPGRSIERNNNNGNYEPGNCRWATQAEQSRNTRQSHWIECAGRKQVLVDWAAERGMTALLVYKRLKRGWSPEQALGFEPRPHRINP